MSRRRRTIALVGPEAGETWSPFLAARLADLRERGWDAHLVGDGLDRAFGDAPSKPDLLFGFASLALRRPRSAWRGRRRARLLALRPEIVHFGSARAASAARPVGTALGAASVVTLGGDELYGADPEDLEIVREGCQEADVVHLADEALWKRAREIGCPPAVTRAVVPPAADPALLEIVRRVDPGRAESLRLLSVGALTWMAGLEYALQALRLLLDRGISCRYRLLGTGPDLDDLVLARAQFGLEGEVELVVDADRERVREELRSADVYLHSAVIPGLDQGVVEAQAAALPVVGTEGGPLMRKAVADGGGVLVGRRDPEALAEAIAALAEDPGARDRMGHTGRARMKEGFALRAQLDGFARLYEEALGPRSR